mmetsp:Transcript_36952/g.88287  ORF Transcript_36952/g.88287 Transcript_36952/m.88287 type:complete len:269 (-) Transcript_36952:450-1256(-)
MPRHGNAPAVCPNVRAEQAHALEYCWNHPQRNILKHVNSIQGPSHRNDRRSVVSGGEHEKPRPVRVAVGAVSQFGLVESNVQMPFGEVVVQRFLNTVVRLVGQRSEQAEVTKLQVSAVRPGEFHLAQRRVRLIDYGARNDLLVPAVRHIRTERTPIVLLEGSHEGPTDDGNDHKMDHSKSHQGDDANPIPCSHFPLKAKLPHSTKKKDQRCIQERSVCCLNDKALKQDAFEECFADGCCPAKVSLKVHEQQAQEEEEEYSQARKREPF